MIDIKERLDAELPPPGAAPVRITDEALVRGGRKARRRRHILAGIGTAVAAVTVVAVGVSVLAPTQVPTPNGSAPAADQGANPDQLGGTGVEPQHEDDQSIDDITDIDPDRFTESEEYPDPAAQKLAPDYSKALTSYLDTEFPDAVMVYAPDDSGQAAPLDSESEAVIDMGRVDRRLIDDVESNDDTGEPNPSVDSFLYESRFGPLDQTIDGDTATSYPTSVFYAIDGDPSENQAINVRYYPAGGFVQGAENQLDISYCYFAVQDDCLRESVTGPDGEQIVEVRGIADQTLGEGGEPVNQSVLYRSDGSAIVVTATIDTVDGPLSSLTEPTLSPKQLTGIALALPTSVLE